MFSKKEFIALSRKFVCVRLDPYEKKAHEEWVRKFLGGRFENTVFCLLAPDGVTRLTRSGRGPEMALGDEGAILKTMGETAEKYPAKLSLDEVVAPDFYSFAEALNVASCDQRPLVLVSGSEAEMERARREIAKVAGNAKAVGRFHYDFESGEEWVRSVTGAKAGAGITVVRPGRFGIDGEVMAKFEITETAGALADALQGLSEEFGRTTEAKIYDEHRREGNRLGLVFSGEVPLGEDRDADGKPDDAGVRPRRGDAK